MMFPPGSADRSVRYVPGAAWTQLRYTTDVSWPVEKILGEAFKLDLKDRALVVAELSSSEGIATPEEVEAAWREEIARRVKSLQDGTAVLHDWDEVNEEISSIFKGA